MKCSPWVTLTYSEWRELSQRMTDLSLASKNVFDIIKTDGQLYQSIKQLEESFEICEKQSEVSWKKRYDEFDQLRQQLNLTTVWCLYEIDDLGDPHPFEGAREIYVWGGRPAKESVIEIPGSSWLDLWIATDQAVNAVGEQHYRFVEDFDLHEDGRVLPVLGS